MKSNQKKIKDLINWLNSLDDVIRGYVLKFVSNNCLFGLNDEDFLKVKELRSIIIEMINQNLDKEQIIKKLLLLGLEDVAAEKLYFYAIKNAMILDDAMIVKKLNQDKLEKIVDFVINKIFLYDDALLYPFDYFVKTYEFSNSDEAGKTVRVLYNLIGKVSERKYSINTLKVKLEKDLDFPCHLSEVIVKKVTDNIEELQKVYITTKLRELFMEEDEEGGEEAE